jgi:HD-GYP domain-containing protein (c-di-GMP phosphodiesterase class II)
MKHELNVSLNQFVFSLSQALDLINPVMADHHKRVAYIALRVAETMGLSGRAKEDVVIAAALHDIGTLPRQSPDGETFPTSSLRSARFGYQLLRKFKPFDKSARIVRFHWVDWARGQNREMEGETVPTGSHIVHLANCVNRLVDRDKPILWQAGDICTRVGDLRDVILMPALVDAFLKVSASDAFWLDLNASDLPSLMAARIPFSAVELDEDSLQDFAELLAQIIDFRSRFTATHSSGVAATAATLAQLFGFPEADCKRIQVAGYLHDLGKLAIPAEYLEKNGKLTEEEWLSIRSHPYYTYRILASINGLEDIAHWCGVHHERLSGAGYPFGANNSRIPLEARILSVADIFTALCEDRPYRCGLDRQSVLAILKKMVDGFELDRKIFEVLEANYTDLDHARIGAQKLALKEYQSFMESLAVLDLSGARAAHAAWKRRLRNYLDGNATLSREQMVNHRECDLGRWYHGEGLRHYGDIPEMQELVEPHRALHDLIRVLVEHKENGRFDAAELCYQQIEPISNRIITLLHAIEGKATQYAKKLADADHSQPANGDEKYLALLYLDKMALGGMQVRSA